MNGNAWKSGAAGSVTISRQEDMQRPATARKTSPPIDPAVKSWIDQVIAPAIAEQWLSREGSKAA